MNRKRRVGPVTAGGSVVVAAAVGVVTNLVTSHRSIGLGAALIVLVGLGVMFVLAGGRPTSTGAGVTVTQRVTASGDSIVVQAGRDVRAPDGLVG